MSADDIKLPPMPNLSAAEDWEAAIHAWGIAAIQADRASRASSPQGDAEDAARYRWLRQRWGRVTETYDGDSGRIVEIGTEPEGDGWDVEPETLDAAVDAAMAKDGER